MRAARPPASGAWLRSLWRGALDVLAPETCLHCGRPGAALCEPCLWGAPRGFGELRCPGCEGPPAGFAERCPDCAGDAASADASLLWVAAAAPYVDPWRTWIQRAKRAPEPALAVPFARRLAEALAACEPAPDWWLVPVPRGNRRGVLTGPSLPAALARELHGQLGLRVAHPLLRRRPGRPQQGRSREARRQLQAADYAVGALPRRCGGLILVDDVMTTGATLRAMTAALRRRAPGLPVAAAVLARAGAPVA